MGEIRIVGPGKTRRYPYPVCEKKWLMFLDDTLFKVYVYTDMFE